MDDEQYVRDAFRTHKNAPFTNEYPVLVRRHVSMMSLEEISALRHPIWSARLSTGLFGRHNCRAGNRGPKGLGEVLLGFGDEGLESIFNLGFIPCPVCKPENVPHFWDDLSSNIQGKVMQKYGDFVEKPSDFCDKNKVGFDPRRLDWDALVPEIGAVPGRIYLPNDLTGSELGDFKGRIFTLVQLYLGPSAAFPKLGFYDHTAPGRFTEF